MLWIKVSTELPRHSKLFKLARRLKISRHEAIGYLVQLWSFAILNYSDGKINANADEIAFGVDLDPQLDPQEFVDALCDCASPNVGFLEREKNGTFRVHDWQEFSGSLEISREKSREKMRVWREKKKIKAEQIESESEVIEKPCNGNVTVTETVTERLRNGSVTSKNKNKNQNKNKKNLFKTIGRVSENSPCEEQAICFDDWVQEQLNIIRTVVEAPKPGNLPELLAQWRETYGAQTVEETVAKAMRWLQDNGRRYKDMGRFIGRWLARDAESPRAVARRTGQSVPDYGDTLPDWNDLLGGERNEA